MEKRGISSTKRQLRKLQKDPAVQQLLRSPATEGDVDYAIEHVAWTMPGDTREDKMRNASTALELLFWSYLKALDPATAQSNQAVSRKIDQLTAASVEERRRADARVSFDDTLQRYLPMLRDLAKSIQAKWPRIEVVAADLALPLTRDGLLRQWSANHPDWFDDAPPDLLVWLALMAGRQANDTTAFALWELAIARGAYPREVAIAYAALSLALTDEGRARALLDAGGTDHPFSRAARAALNQDAHAVIAALEDWSPTEPQDQSQRDVMTAAAYLDAGDVDRALSEARAAWKRYESPGAAILAARCLLSRAQKLGAIARTADAQQAVELAVAAREKRRQWGGDAGEAVELALVGLHLLHDADRAWSLTQVPPIGEATAEEASDQRIEAHAALAAALTGRTDVALRLASERLSGFAKAHVEAVIAEWGDDTTHALQAWTRCWNEATTDLERIQSASGVVHAGGPFPDLGTTRDVFPDVADELGTLAEALSASDPITQLRARLSASPIFLVELARRLRAEGQQREAAEALDDGASRWADPLLAAMAAREFLDSGFEPEAIAAARKALDLGGANWSSRRTMLALIIDAEGSRLHWGDAAAAARQLLADNPGDESAEWALTAALFNSAEPEMAWETLTRTGHSLRPRTRPEVVLWLRLNGRYNSDPAFLDDAFEIVSNWQDDEAVLGTFVQVMIFPGHLRVEVSEDQAELIRSSIEDFTQRYPESDYLRAITLGPDDDPLRPMHDLLKEGAERHAEVAKQARAGSIPLGLLSFAVNRTYAEASLHRAANGVLAEFPLRPEHEDTAAACAATAICVLDATSAHTLALMDDTTRTVLLGTCQSVVVTDGAYRDAFAARDALRARSTMSLSWDLATAKPIFSEITEEQADDLAKRSEGLLAVMAAVRRQTYPNLAHFPAEFSRAAAWLSAVDLAKAKGYVLWSDDRVLRGVAASMGIQPFGTLALLDHLESTGRLTAQDRTVNVAKLLSNYYVDIPYSLEPYRLATALDSYRAGGAAAALSRPSVWADPEATFRHAQDTLRTLGASRPDELQRWCFYVSSGLLAVATGNSAMCSNNLATFLGRCVSEAWCNGVSLPFVLAAIREAMSACPDGPEDPLEGVLRNLHRVAVEQLGDTGAKTFLLGVVGSCRPEDKQTAAGVILTAPRA